MFCVKIWNIGQNLQPNLRNHFFSNQKQIIYIVKKKLNLYFGKRITSKIKWQSRMNASELRYVCMWFYTCMGVERLLIYTCIYKCVFKEEKNVPSYFFFIKFLTKSKQMIRKPRPAVPPTIIATVLPVLPVPFLFILLFISLNIHIYIYMIFPKSLKLTLNFK